MVCPHSSRGEDSTVLEVLIDARGWSQYFIREGCMGVNSAVRNDVRTAHPAIQVGWNVFLLEVFVFQVDKISGGSWCSPWAVDG